MLAGLGMLEIFDRRNVRHWAAGLVGATAVGFGLVWMGIRSDYRRTTCNWTISRPIAGTHLAHRRPDLDFFRSDTDSLMVTLDNMVDRMWPIYYPRWPCPACRPACHTNGAILSAALQHITMPRVFSRKAELGVRQARWSGSIRA